MLRTARAVALLARTQAATCSCPPAAVTGPASRLQSFLRPAQPSLNAPISRGYASKKKGKKEVKEVEDEDDYVPVVKGKGGKKGKGKSKDFEEDEPSDAAEEEAFDLKKLESNMDEAVDKLRVSLKSVVGRVGRVSPDLLDSIKVESEGKRRPLSEFAAVSVKDGKDLIVAVYEESFMKIVSEALYASSLSLTPQVASATTLRVPIPKPDWDKRQQLVKQTSELCENTRVSIRNFRTVGQKDIKSDVDRKLATKDDGRADTKKLDTATKKRTDEVDTVFEKAKKLLMDE